MRRISGYVLLLAGAGVLLFAAIQYVQHQTSMKEALAEANAIISAPDQTQSGSGPNEAPEGTQFGPLMDRTEFRPELGEAIGVLYVPQLDVELPIVEGTDDEMLERGVGHYTSTALPSDNEQILLSGHRDTVFRDFDQLSVGDRFVVKLPYGVFEYEIQSTDIVDKDDTTVIRPMGTEVLVVSTCYPFRYLGNAPERFIFYAYPVDFPLHS
ncbi:class D sortase [Paenibacillus campinasensis]|uniref:Class D sortase n=1 Tax=Paenibacillus campinasensis TaxID=66347 RepID=A0A268EWB2_9BACL|nr:class D sortase [Paenibacillus campinasensis]PAD77401.1 class D sortase [Paenibacillus campinasensis]